jgi:type IV pilus assembly protein PilE
MRRSAGLTLIEILTLVVALVVIVAVTIPLWRTHELRAQRKQAIQVLQDVQSAQDRYFGAHAQYADAAHLGVALEAPHYGFEVTLSDDRLAYVASAIASKGAIGGTADARCSRLSIDQHGRRSAADSAGDDSTADCWKRK